MFLSRSFFQRFCSLVFSNGFSFFQRCFFFVLFFKKVPLFFFQGGCLISKSVFFLTCVFHRFYFNGVSSFQWCFFFEKNSSLSLFSRVLIYQWDVFPDVFFFRVFAFFGGVLVFFL